MLTIHCIDGRQLTDGHILAWRRILAANPALASGLFRPEFIQTLARHRPRIEVAVLSRAGRIVGFFPFWRSPWGTATAPSGPLADLQAAVIPADLPLDPRQLLLDCKLRTWKFNHLLADQRPFRSFHIATSESPYIDLSQGFEAYREERRRARSDELREALRKGRKIQREVGRLRLEAYDQNERTLDTLLHWKTAQLRRAGQRNALTRPWIRSLFLDLMQTRQAAFAGMLSALYVGDQLAAATMGIRSQTVLHGWVTAFNPALRRYSPGILLLAELAQAAESLGIQRIDMGRGPEPYKRSFRSDATWLAEGVVSRDPLAGFISGSWVRARHWIKGSPLHDSARHVVQIWRGIRSGRVPHGQLSEGES